MEQLFDRELEVKILGVDHEAIAARIVDLGGKFIGVEEQENYRIDSSAHPIEGEDYLRLRVTHFLDGLGAGKTTRELTYKKRIFDREVRNNEEHTIPVEDVEKTLSLLALLGYDVVIRSDKRRETYEIDDTKVEFDQWDETTRLAPYIEVEAPNKEVLGQVLRKLEIPIEAVSTRSVKSLRLEVDLEQTIDFSVVLEEMKRIYRQTHIIGEDRYENDAEHSWHIATNAILFERYADQPVDMAKVIQMLLVHDLVEIYSGDTFAYDTVGSLDMKEREHRAMRKIQKQLDEATGVKVAALWEEFDAQLTYNSHYALAMDRVQPIIANLRHGNGGSWKDHGVHIDQVYKRIEPVEEASKMLHEYLVRELKASVDKGWLLA